MTRHARLAALGCGAAVVVGALVARSRPAPLRPAPVVRAEDRHEREREHEEEEDGRGPLQIRRPGAAELAVRNRVALAESTKLRARARGQRAQVDGSAVAGANWVSLGPTVGGQQLTGTGIVSGRINDVVVDPRDANVVYVASSGGGVWKTFDAWSTTGARWLPLTDTLPNLAAGALAIDAAHPDTLYLGSGDFFHGAGNTVTKTVDGGATWSAPVVLEGAYSTELVARVSSLRSIGVHGARVIAGTDAGLFVSVDAGGHFELVDLPDPSGNVLPEAIWTVLPIGDDHWIASGVTGCNERTLPPRPRSPGADPGGGADCAYGNNAVLWYSNDGKAWTIATMPTLTGTGRIELAAGRAAVPGDTIAYAYVGAVDHSHNVGYWRTKDGGRSWQVATGTLVNPTLPRNPGEAGDCTSVDLAEAQTWYDQAIAVDPSNPDRVLIGGRLCGARTLNGTSPSPTWELVSHWAPADQDAGKTKQGTLDYVHADWQTAALVWVAGETRALAGTDGGLFVSTNLFRPSTPPATVVWNDQNHGLTTHLMYSVASGDPATGDPFVVFGGLQDNGTQLRTDPTRGAVFTEIIGGDGIGATVHAATSGTTYWGSFQFTRAYCKAHVDDCADPDRWSYFEPLPGDPAARPAPGGDSEPFSIHYANVETDTDGPSVLTHSVGQVFVSVPAGEGLAWKAISQDVSFDEIYLTNVTASPTIPGLYGAAAATGFRGSGTSIVPFYVTTTGNTPSRWRAADPVRPVPPNGALRTMSAASSIAFPPVLPPDTVPGQVYIGAFAGVLDDAEQTPPPDDQGRLYRTKNFGESWTSIGGADPTQRLPNVSIYVVKYDPVSPTTIYAGTELGVYVSGDDGMTWNRLGQGLPIVPVRDLYVARNQEFIRVATFGRGLWELFPSASAPRGAPGNGDYDRDQQINWIDVAAMASRLGTAPTTMDVPLYTWILDVSGEGSDPPVQAIDEADLAALLGKLGGRP